MTWSLCAARRSRHHSRLRRLHAQRQCRYDIGTHVDAQDLHHVQRQRNAAAAQSKGHKGYRLGRVAGQNVTGKLADVGVHGPPLLDRRHDRGKVVVGQDQVGGFFGHIGAGHPHGHADVGLL